jgi:hypothetical protein
MNTVKAPVDIGKVIQNAVVFDLKKWAEIPMNIVAEIKQRIARFQKGLTHKEG